MNLVAAPVLVPLLAALLLFLGPRSTRFREVLSAGAGLVQLGVGVALLLRVLEQGILVLPVGAWGAPYGIVLVADLLAVVMGILAAVTMLGGMAYGWFEMAGSERHPLRLPLLQFLSAGIQLSFLTGDLFNLFVAFEILLVSSYALLTIEADDWDIQQAYPYLILNAVGSVMFFCAAGLVYGWLGTLNLAELSQRAAEVSGDPRLTALAVLLLAVFGMKAGLFPLYYWLPHSYPTLPTPVAAVFAGLLTKVGVYVLFRMLTTVLPHDLTAIHRGLAWISAATMILGVLGAISRDHLRGILSFHILSQVAFMTLALGMFTPVSVAAGIFYVVHHILVKASLFLIAGVAALLNRSDDLGRMGNLRRAAPWVALVFLGQALSLAGLPPLSGFWGKYLIVVEGLAQGRGWLVALSLVASLLTLFSMLKIWLAAFWREADGVPVALNDRRWRPLAGLATVFLALSLGLGLGAEPMLRLATRASAMALDQAGYQAAVSEARGKEVRP